MQLKGWMLWVVVRLERASWSGGSDRRCDHRQDDHVQSADGPEARFDPATQLDSPRLPRRLPRPISDAKLTAALTLPDVDPPDAVHARGGRVRRPSGLRGRRVSVAGLRCRRPAAAPDGEGRSRADGPVIGRAARGGRGPAGAPTPARVTRSGSDPSYRDGSPGPVPAHHVSRWTNRRARLLASGHLPRAAAPFLTQIYRATNVSLAPDGVVQADSTRVIVGVCRGSCLSTPMPRSSSARSRRGRGRPWTRRSGSYGDWASARPSAYEQRPERPQPACGSAETRAQPMARSLPADRTGLCRRGHRPGGHR
jgi:hypothetical protein